MSIDSKLDLTFAKVVAEQMDDYVHTEVLFYPIGAAGGMQMPQLTIGAWLETAWRLKALDATLTSEQHRTVESAKASAGKVRSRAPELYKQKARREYRSRLDTWNWYLEDLLSHPEGTLAANAQSYATQVHIRLKLELLGMDVSQMQDQVRRLETSDLRMRTRFIHGSFVWEPDLQPVAPVNPFWWLYGRPS